MSAPVSTLFTQQYQGAVELLLQQSGPKLRGAVMEGSYVGEAANPVDQVGQVKPPITIILAPGKDAWP